jgi:predicted GNAT family N-acyltransferase
VAVDPEHGIIGTCRLLSEDGTVARIGRMAVLAEFRRRGIAEAMLALAERHASDEGATSVILDAQLPARIFYERAGYVAHGPVFLDAGIEHVAMTKQLPPR